MKVIIASNMGAKPSSPLQGLFVDNQVERLKRTGLDISYFFMRFNGDTLLHKLFKYPVFFLRFVFKYILSFEKYDVIHVHYYYPTIISAYLYKRLRNPNVKVVVTCHGSDIYAYPTPNKLYKSLTNIVDHWFFTSNKLKDRFFKNVESYNVLCAGFDDEVFRPSEFESEKTIDCLFVGTLDNNKGVDRLLWLVEQLPDVRFLVVGTGHFKEKIQKYSDSYSNLSYVGSKLPHEVAKLMGSAKLLLSLSRNESFGLVMSEAHACGTPTIATETDGSLAQLESWPFLIPQEEEEQEVLESMKDKIVSICAMDKDEYKKLQQVVYERSKEFSLTAVSAQIFREYQLLKVKGRSE